MRARFGRWGGCGSVRDSVKVWIDQNLEFSGIEGLHERVDWSAYKSRVVRISIEFLSKELMGLC